MPFVVVAGSDKLVSVGYAFNFMFTVMFSS